MTLVASLGQLKASTGLGNVIGRIKTAGLVLVSLFLLLGCDSGSQPLASDGWGQSYKWSGQTMGTYYRITLIDTDNRAAASTASRKDHAFNLPAAKQQVNKVLQSIIDSMSTYKPDSELSRFNQLTAPACLAVSDDLLNVVNLALQVNKASGGAFNPLVGPLVNRWGFGSSDFNAAEFELPGEREIQGLLAATDISSLSVDQQQQSLCKSADIELDLSAIAKGYGVDKVAQALEQLGINNYLVDIGGEVRVNGLNPRGQSWRLAIEKPGLQVGTVQQTLSLETGAIATSGDYRNFIEHQGIRYSHSIDPRSGFPVQNQLVSVSVIAANTALADAWATAFSVMGAEQTRQMAEKMSLAVYLLKRENKAQDAGDVDQQHQHKEPITTEIWYSSAFSRYMQ